MKSIQDYCKALGVSASTLLSARRLATRGHRISKDISYCQERISCLTVEINSQEERILKLQEEARLITEFTAQRAEIIQRVEPVLEKEKEIKKGRIETNLQSNGDPQWSQDDLDWLSSLMITPDATTSQDLLCYETAWEMPELFPDQASELDGYMAYLVSESPASPTMSFPKPI